MSINPTPFPVMPAEDATRALNAAQTALARAAGSVQPVRFSPEFTAALTETHEALRVVAARAVVAAGAALAECVQQSRAAR